MPGHIERLDAVFSLWVRLSNSDHAGRVTCITCGVRGSYRDFDCGHFVPRANQATRFSEKNCRPQCRYCNRDRGGRPDLFASALDKLYGVGTSDDLRRLGKSVCKRSKPEIAALVDYYRAEVARLKKEKGL